MDNEIKFACKVWATSVIGGSILSSLLMLLSNFSADGFLFGLLILFFAATRGIPSLILFYTATALINKTNWTNKIKINVLVILGALLCLTNIILFLYRKKLEELLYLPPVEAFVILGFALCVVAAVFYFKRQLFAPSENEQQPIKVDLEQQQ